MKSVYWLLLYGCLFCTVMVACGDASGNKNYAATVKKELATGKRYDSLFLGIHLGMTSKEFYSWCWDLNKKGILTNGSNNTSVLYKISNQLKHQTSMNFYPDFFEDRIFSMWATFQYDAWAPWNKGYGSDSLLTDVLHLFRQWYPQGNDFIEMTDKNRGTIYVKVDGNRRIIAGRYTDGMVKVDFTDLIIEQKLKK